VEKEGRGGEKERGGEVSFSPVFFFLSDGDLERKKTRKKRAKKTKTEK
jgi:hypothetical protein